MTNLPPTKFDADYIDLRLIWRSLIEKRWLIIGVSLIFVIVAISYALLRPTQYQASILLQIEQKQHASLGAISKSNGLMNQDNTPEEPLSVQMALIRSKFILGPVIESLGLDIQVKKPSMIPYLYKKNNRDIKISRLNVSNRQLNKKLQLFVTSKNHYDLYDEQHHLLTSGVVGKRNIKNKLEIKVEKLDAASGQSFIIIKKPETEVLKKLLTHLTIIDLSNTNDNQPNKIGILQITYTDDNPERVRNVLNKIAEVTQQKSIKYKTQQAENKLAFLREQLPLAKQSLRMAESKLNLYRSTTGKEDVKLKTHDLMAHLTDLDKQLQELRLKKSNLLQQYTTQYPFVRLTNDKITELKKNRLKIYNQLKKLPAADETAATLKRDIAVKNQLYINLLNQIHELEIIKAGMVSDNHILVLASIPDAPIPIQLNVIGFVSLIVGLILGCLGVIAFKILTRRIEDPHWSEKTWNIKNLANIPYSKNQALNRPQTQPLFLLAHQLPNDMALESLRYLRTYFQLQHFNSSNNIISIMGFSKGVGKTFVTVNLACLMAKIGLKILLIDCDLRHGYMHLYFNNKRMKGLTDIITGQVHLQDVLHQSSQLPSLHFLASGTQCDDPTTLLTSTTFKSLLNEQMKHYQFILINSSNSKFPSDCVLIGSQAGINLLVLGANHHHAIETTMAIKHFHHIGLDIHGSIFNHAKPNKKMKRHRLKHWLSKNIKQSDHAQVLP